MKTKANKRKSTIRYFVHPGSPDYDASDMLYKVKDKSIAFYLNKGEWHRSFFSRFGLKASFLRTHNPISRTEARKLIKKLDAKSK